MRRIALVPLLFILLLPTALASGQTGGSPRIECSFEVEEAGAGQEVLLNILAWDAQDLYAYQFDLSYDPELVQVIDDDPQRAGVNARFRDFLTPDLVIYNQADNVEGLLSLGASKAYPAEAVSGSGLLAQVRLQAVEAGSASFAFVNLTAADEMAALLDFSSHGCSLEVSEGTPPARQTAAASPQGDQPPAVQTAVAGVVGTATPTGEPGAPSILRTSTPTTAASVTRGASPPDSGAADGAGGFWRSVAIGFGGALALAALTVLGLWLRARQ